MKFINNIIKYFISLIQTVRLETKEDFIRNTLYETVREFVEDEDGLNEVLWNYDEGSKKQKKVLDDVYLWITSDRSLLVDKIKELDKYFLDVENHITDKHNRFDDSMNLFYELKRKDSDYMKKIIDLLEYIETP